MTVFNVLPIPQFYTVECLHISESHLYISTKQQCQKCTKISKLRNTLWHLSNQPSTGKLEELIHQTILFNPMNGPSQSKTNSITIINTNIG